MKMYFEWAWMNHGGLVELLRWLVWSQNHFKGQETLAQVVLVQVTIKWRSKCLKDKDQKTNEPQKIKSQWSKMKKNESPNVYFLIVWNHFMFDVL